MEREGTDHTTATTATATATTLPPPPPPPQPSLPLSWWQWPLHSQPSPLSSSCWRRTTPTPAKPMPGGHQVVITLPHWCPSLLAAMACLLCCHRCCPLTARRLPPISFVEHALPPQLLPALRCHCRRHHHLRPPPSGSSRMTTPLLPTS